MVTLADGQQKKGASREIVPCAGYVRHVTHVWITLLVTGWSPPHRNAASKQAVF